MKTSELILILTASLKTQGDLPVVLWDLDTRSYYKLNNDNIEFQVMSDDSERLSIGVNNFYDEHESKDVSARGALLK